MSGAYVTTADDRGVTVMTVDRPPVNEINLELVEALNAELGAIAAVPPPALVIAGRPGCFSAGLDLKATPAYTTEQRREMVAAVNAMIVTAYGLPCPVVAAITGHAIAGGFVLALCADYRIASSAGQYGLTEVKVGVPYPAAAITIVRRELDAPAARRFALRGELVGAAECVDAGAFDEAVARDDVLDRALEIARQLAELPADVYARTKVGLRGETILAMRTAIGTDPLSAA